MGKQLGEPEAEIRLWLEAAAEAGLVGSSGDVVLPTAAADDWVTADPARALVTLLLGWWRLPIVPGFQQDEYGKALPALASWYGDGSSTRLRAEALVELAGLPGDRGLVELDSLATVMGFRLPFLAGGPEGAVQLEATLDEAMLLGLVADGALTPLGRDLLAAVPTADPVAALAAAAAGTLPARTGTATFLPDLTVVVAGAATVELARLLDDVATAESRDTASTWRLTRDSVRRALDAGRTAEGLLAELAGVADKPLPQPLGYLVHDVARRHGEVRVLAVACCLRVADPALGAELVAARALAPLRLRTLADTVLASSESVDRTVAALRGAGYAPVRQDARGETVIERTPVRRAEPRPRFVPTGAGDTSGARLAALAERLSGPGPDQLW
jgi:hypothetical protein